MNLNLILKKKEIKLDGLGNIKIDSETIDNEIKEADWVVLINHPESNENNILIGFGNPYELKDETLKEIESMSGIKKMFPYYLVKNI